MPSRSDSRPVPTPAFPLATLPRTEGGALLSLARSLAAGVGAPASRGRNLALVCEEDNADTALLRRAATGLGMQVARIRPALGAGSSPRDIEETARVLGRLYAAVEWPGMPLAMLEQVARGAGVPVYDGMSSAGHPLAQLAGQLPGEASHEDKRCLLLQAVLVGTLS